MEPQDAKVMVEAFHDAINRHDVEGALAFLATDATAEFPNQSTDVIRGTAELRAWLEQDVARGIHVTIENLRIDGERATWTAKLGGGGRQSEGTTLTGLAEITFKNGKIAAFKFADRV